MDELGQVKVLIAGNMGPYKTGAEVLSDPAAQKNDHRAFQNPSAWAVPRL